MKYSRVDTTALREATAKAVRTVEGATEALSPFTVMLTETERQRTLRAPSDFADAGRALAVAMAAHPDVAAAARYEGGAVVEDLDNVRVLAGLVPVLAELQQRIADTLLVWNAEAYQQSLAAYAAARGLERARPELRTLVAPMAEVFGSRRRSVEAESGEGPTGG